MLQSPLLLRAYRGAEIEIYEYNFIMGKEHLNVSREELYRQVWEEPISKLAAAYNVSGSTLR